MFVETTYIIPPDARADISAFRRWALSDGSPERGRFDFVAGGVEVEWTSDDLFTHGTLRSELFRGIAELVSAADGGYVFAAKARFSVPIADLSVQPDAMFVGYDSIESGRVRLVPKGSGEAGRYVEIEGPPDLIVEVVSDGTVRKDTIRLPRAYFEAGVTEFWLADGRKADLSFVLHARGKAGFEPVAADAEGYQSSAVLGRSFRLDRTRDRLGAWRHDLVSK